MHNGSVFAYRNFPDNRPVGSFGNRLCRASCRCNVSSGCLSLLWARRAAGGGGAGGVLTGCAPGIAGYAGCAGRLYDGGWSASYGNRAYGEALLQLSDFLAAKGFVTVAAGAFVGEHSYSSARYPIAAGRPDDADLAMAQEWGAAVRRKLDAADAIVPVDVSRMQEPQSPALSKQRFAEFIVSLQQGKSSPQPLAPTTDPDRCTHCGCCVAMCPAGAIVAGDEWHTDASLCIKCCACVKGCPAGARSFPTPFAPVLSQYFGERKPPVTIV